VSDKPVVLITAGSRGIGEACARKFHSLGYAVALMARNEDVHLLATELNGLGIVGDITNQGDIKHFILRTLETFQRIDAVVCNTGHADKGDLLDITSEQWHLGLDLLVLNTHRIAQLVLPIMKKQGYGAFINISSFGAIEPSADFPISSVIRGALTNYTKLFSDKYGKENIRMNNVLPGFVDSYEVDEETREKIPMKREAKTEEIASVVAFLASENASYITGQNIRVDGGLTRSI